MKPVLPIVLSLWLLPVLLPPVAAAPAAHAPGQARAAQVRQNDNPAPGKSGQAPGRARGADTAEGADGDNVDACLEKLGGWHIASPAEIATLRDAQLMTAPGCKAGGGLDWSERAALAGNAGLARYFEGRGLALQAVVGVIVKDSGEAAIIIAK